jgi:hypothetical protein
MAGPVPAIHVFGLPRTYKDADARDERGHDELSDRIPDSLRSIRATLAVAHTNEGL